MDVKIVEEKPTVEIKHRRHGDPEDAHFHRRKRVLTDEDIAEFAVAFEKVFKVQSHSCRFMHVDEEKLDKVVSFYEKFEGIDPKRFNAAIDFFENWNKSLDDSKNVIRRTLLVIAITAIAGMTIAGFWLEVSKKAILTK